MQLQQSRSALFPFVLTDAFQPVLRPLAPALFCFCGGQLPIKRLPLLGVWLAGGDLVSLGSPSCCREGAGWPRGAWEVPVLGLLGQDPQREGLSLGPHPPFGSPKGWRPADR